MRTAAMPAVIPTRQPTANGYIWPLWITGRFPEFCQVVGLPELATDPKFSTSTAYYANKKELVAILDEKFKEHPLPYWHELLNAMICRTKSLHISRMFRMIRRSSPTIMLTTMNTPTERRPSSQTVRPTSAPSIRTRSRTRFPGRSDVIRLRS